MSPLNELRPFVSFCQACGMIPFHMEQSNSIPTRSFTFRFSLKRFTTWWFVAVAIAQIVTTYIISQLFREMAENDIQIEAIPMTALVLGMFTLFGVLVIMAIPRWIVIRRYRNLNNALKALQDVDVGITHRHKPKSSITLRFIVGFSLIVSTVFK